MAPEHVQIARVRVAPEILLHLRRKRVQIGDCSPDNPIPLTHKLATWRGALSESVAGTYSGGPPLRPRAASRTACSSILNGSVSSAERRATTPVR